MKSVISWFQNMLLRQVITIFFTAFAFLAMQFVGYSNLPIAQADTVKSSQGIYYKGVPDGNAEKFSQKGNIVEEAKDTLKNTAENIREKLNLDEPVPQSTKDFLKSTQEKFDETVEPITTPENKYYQTPGIK